MTITEFFAQLDGLPKSTQADIFLVTHMVCKYQGRQYRDSGEPYLEHVFDVMYQLIQMRLDRDIIIAGGLHDLIEDTEVTADDIERTFNSRVAFIVKADSKMPKSCFVNKQARLEEFHERFLECARIDSGLIWPRFADRLHNLTTLHGLSNDPSKQDRIARETLGFYIPFLEGEALILVPRRRRRYIHVYRDRMYHLAMAFLKRVP